MGLGAQQPVLPHLRRHLGPGQRRGVEVDGLATGGAHGGDGVAADAAHVGRHHRLHQGAGHGRVDGVAAGTQHLETRLDGGRLGGDDHGLHGSAAPHLVALQRGSAYHPPGRPSRLDGGAASDLLKREQVEQSRRVPGSGCRGCRGRARPRVTCPLGVRHQEGEVLFQGDVAAEVHGCSRRFQIMGDFPTIPRLLPETTRRSQTNGAAAPGTAGEDDGATFGIPGHGWKLATQVCPGTYVLSADAGARRKM